MVTTDQMDRMLIAMAKGQTEPFPDLNAEERAMWFKLAEDVAKIKAQGLIVEIPGEIPDVSEEEKEK